MFKKTHTFFSVPSLEICVENILYILQFIFYIFCVLHAKAIKISVFLWQWNLFLNIMNVVASMPLYFPFSNSLVIFSIYFSFYSTFSFSAFFSSFFFISHRNIAKFKNGNHRKWRIKLLKIECFISWGFNYVHFFFSFF